jgi:hypothetical protein
VSGVFVKKEKEMAEKIDGWIYFQLNQHFLEENKSKRDKGLMYIGKVFFEKNVCNSHSCFTHKGYFV